MIKTKKQVKCVSAKSAFYKAGEVYDVYIDAMGMEFVKGSDGFYDNPKKALSKFTPAEKKTKNAD